MRLLFSTILFITVSINAIGQEFNKEFNQLLTELKAESESLVSDLNNLKEKIELELAPNHSVSVLGGYTENGFSILGSYNIYNKKNIKNRYDFIELSVLASFTHENQSDYEVPVHNYTVNAGYFKKFNLLGDEPKDFVTAIGIGGVFGYESINTNDTELPNGAVVLDKSKFIYGGFIGANINIFLSEEFNLTAKSNLYYHPNSDVGQTKIFIGIGLTYSLLKNKK